MASSSAWRRCRSNTSRARGCITACVGVVGAAVAASAARLRCFLRQRCFARRHAHTFFQTSRGQDGPGCAQPCLGQGRQNCCVRTSIDGEGQAGTMYSGAVGLFDCADYMRFAEMLAMEANWTVASCVQNVDLMIANHLPAALRRGTGERRSMRTTRARQLPRLRFRSWLPPVTESGMTAWDPRRNIPGGAAGTVFWIDPVEEKSSSNDRSCGRPGRCVRGSRC